MTISRSPWMKTGVRKNWKESLVTSSGIGALLMSKNGTWNVSLYDWIVANAHFSQTPIIPMTSFSSCEQTEKNDKIYKYMQQITLSISMIKIKVSFSSVKINYMYLNKVKIKTLKKKENISLINDLYLLVCVSYFFFISFKVWSSMNHLLKIRF